MIETVYKGQTLPVRFGPVLDEAGVPVALTGSVACKAVQTSPTAGVEVAAILTAIEGDGTGGEASAEFSPSQTNLWPIGSIWKYDGACTRGDGKVVPLGGGTFRIAELVSVD